MASIHCRSAFATRFAGGGLALLIGCAAAACGGTRASSPPPSTAGAPSQGHRGASGQQQRGAVGSAQAQPGPTGPSTREDRQGDQSGPADAELVVSREIVSRCPTLRLVRKHIDEIDPDMVWLAVLESIGDCMSEGGPMSAQQLGVSGDEEHRRVVREVLGTRGVAGERVVARPTSQRGSAECQGGEACDNVVEITIIAP